MTPTAQWHLLTCPVCGYAECVNDGDAPCAHAIGVGVHAHACRPGDSRAVTANWHLSDDWCGHPQENFTVVHVLLAPATAREFFDAVYPFITEAGPDLNLTDCAAITSWLAAAA